MANTGTFSVTVLTVLGFINIHAFRTVPLIATVVIVSCEDLIQIIQKFLLLIQIVSIIHSLWIVEGFPWGFIALAIHIIRQGVAPVVVVRWHAFGGRR